VDGIDWRWLLDWKWVLALPVMYIINRIATMGRELEALRRQFAAMKADDLQPFPSDDSEEAKAIKIAKALHKSFGEAFTWAQAKKAAKHIREQQRRKEQAQETASGDGNRKTA